MLIPYRTGAPSTMIPQGLTPPTGASLPWSGAAPGRGRARHVLACPATIAQREASRVRRVIRCQHEGRETASSTDGILPDAIIG